MNTIDLDISYALYFKAKKLTGKTGDDAVSAVFAGFNFFTQEVATPDSKESCDE